MHLLSEFSLRNRALIALLTIVATLFGVYSLTALRQELIPSISFPQLVIVSSYPGASPDVVETDVSTPIETAIQIVPGLESTSAVSSAGSSTIVTAFEYGTDIARAEQQVQLAINRLGGTLPDAVDTQVITGSIDDLPVIQIAVTSELDPVELSTRLNDFTIPDLQALEGVREASLLGTAGERVVITPDDAELAARGLSEASIRDALDDNGDLIAAGQITEGGSTLVVQGGTRLTAADDVAALPLLGGDEPAVIDDVAAVELTTDPVTGISRVNGELALTIAVTKTLDGNTVEVSELVRELIPALEADVGNGTEFTIVFDQAPFIEESIETLATEGALGLIFAVLVILVFLLSVRSTLVTAISIPLSLLITFIGMLAAGYTLNILTLGALTISIGRVVDDSIVVIENIKRHLALGKPKLEAIKTGVREVALAITAATVTTIAVFLPVALVGDVTGELFRPFALTSAIALGSSLFVALTIVPVLAYWFLGRPRRRKHSAAVAAEPGDATAVVETVVSEASSEGSALPVASASSASLDETERPTRLQGVYLPVIRFTLARPLVTILAAVAILAGTAVASTQLETNFIGDSGQNTFTVEQTLEPGTSLDAADEASTEVEAALIELEGIDIVQSSIGDAGGAFAAFFGGGASVVTHSVTADPDADAEELVESVRVRLGELDAPGEISVSAAGAGFASSDIEILVRSSTPEDLERVTSDILDAVSALDSTAQAESNLATQQPYIAIEVDREAAAEVGLSEIAVSGVVAASMLPVPVADLAIDSTTVSIFIDDPDAPLTIEELREFQLPTAVGFLPLEDLATVEIVDGPASISSIRGIRSATVTVTPAVADIGSASGQVRDAVGTVDIPPGTTWELGGVTADQESAFQQLGLALLAAILIIYTIMVATFRSLRQPFLLLVSIPFAATGALLLQLAAGIPLGVPSLIGVLMLTGIVVTNAIVLVDLINQYRDRGMPVREAVILGSARRFRPIIMTSLATIFALVPLGLGLTGSGGFISQPLAVIVIGGLISSTVLTLVVLPTLYYLVEGAAERRAVSRDAQGEPRRRDRRAVEAADTDAVAPSES